jgi:hypothetical protein
VGNKVRSLYLDKDKSLWIGTRSGLSNFQYELNEFKNFTKKDGLSSNIIFGILSDNSENLWLTTPNGMTSIHKTTNDIRQVLIPQNNKLDMGGAAFGLNGQLIVGGTAGFTIFNPNNIKENGYVPNLVFTDFKINNVSYRLEKSISETDDITLRYDQNNLTFEFAALEYTKPSANQYQYYLDGFNDDWMDYGTKRDLTFTNLNPGSYTLYVRGSNNDGVWNEQGIALSLIINPPWWATWWFRGIVISLTLCALIYYNRWKSTKVKNDKRVLNEKIDEATNQVITQNQSLIAQKNQLLKAISEINEMVKIASETGKFNVRINLDNKEDEWKALGVSINALFNSIIEPFNEINRVIRHLEQGDLTTQFMHEAQGDVKEIGDNLNQSIKSFLHSSNKCEL